MLHFSAILALASLSSAHFVLNWPTGAGFDDDGEGTGPCGNEKVTVNSDSTKVNVDRFAVDIFVGHPTGQFTFLGTTDTQEPYTFVPFNQTIKSTNQGTFCAEYMSAPSDFAGKAGILQVIDNSVDGVLYQCAAVNWVSGSNSTRGDSCSNSTNVAITWTPSEAAQNTTTATTTSMASSASAATKSTPTSGLAAMMTVAAVPIIGGLGAVAAGLIL